jgi:hypothetical protein
MWMVVSSQVAAVRIDASETVASRKTRDSQVVGAQSSLSRPLPWTGSSRCRWIDTGTSSPPRGEPEPRDRGVRRCVSPVRSYLPGSAGRAPCSIGRVRLVGVSSQWEVVATGTRALGSAVMPGTLFSCARSWFSIKGQSEAPSAAVLLDAQDPRRPAPPPPGLTPTGQPGVFSDRSAEIVAKRVGPGWLVVQSQSAALARGGSSARSASAAPPSRRAPKLPRRQGPSDRRREHAASPGAASTVARGCRPRRRGAAGFSGSSSAALRPATRTDSEGRRGDAVTVRKFRSQGPWRCPPAR